MEFITGMLLATTLFLLYDKYKKPTKNQSKVDLKQKELDEQEKELAKHFNELMNYTPEKAYRKA